MSKINTIGLDLAKNVFQVHGVDASGTVLVRRQLKRAAVEKFFAQLPPCLVGMEACGSAHHWARVISRYGHEVRLIPPAYVALRQAQQERRPRRRRGLRSCDPTDDAVCSGEEHRATGNAGGS